MAIEYENDLLKLVVKFKHNSAFYQEKTQLQNVLVFLYR